MIRCWIHWCRLTTIKNVIVPKYAGLGANVRFVDRFANFVDANGDIIAARLPDGLHPDSVRLQPHGRHLGGQLSEHTAASDAWIRSRRPQLRTAVSNDGSRVYVAVNGTEPGASTLYWAWTARRWRPNTRSFS